MPDAAPRRLKTLVLPADERSDETKKWIGSIDRMIEDPEFWNVRLIDVTFG